MTIRIKIQNLDKREDAVVTVRTQTKSGTPIPGSPDVEISGGGEAEVYVHGFQRVVVDEGGSSDRKLLDELAEQAQLPASAAVR